MVPTGDSRRGFVDLEGVIRLTLLPDVLDTHSAEDDFTRRVLAIRQAVLF